MGRFLQEGIPAVELLEDKGIGSVTHLLAVVEVGVGPPIHVDAPLQGAYQSDEIRAFNRFRVILVRLGMVVVANSRDSEEGGRVTVRSWTVDEVHVTTVSFSFCPGRK